MKQKKIIKLIAFLLILSICLIVVNNITRKKYAYQKSEDFFNQEEDFDVLFFGSSHIYTSVFPMRLWKDYGMVSYNMGQAKSTIVNSYYNLQLACKETKPKLVVIDTFYSSGRIKIAPGYVQTLHNTYDPYPLSYTKYLAIKDLFGDENLLNNEIEFLFNFSMYHARWNQLTKKDFVAEKTYEKGAESKINVSSAKEISDFDSVSIFNEEETINMKYLRKIIKYCKENNIEILVTCTPYYAPDYDISASKYVQKICNEYNVKYLDFLNMDIIDNNIDYFDKGSHVNVSGARKVTDYLGEYIKKNYNIPDQRENKNYNFWNEDYNEYIDYKIRNLAGNEKNINNYLMLLYGEQDISYEIKISSTKKIEEGSYLQKLLSNLENNYKIDDEAFENNKEKTIKITTWDNRTGQEIKTVWF